MSAAVLAARESSSVYLTSSPPASSVDAVSPAEQPTFAAVGPEGPSEAVNGIARQPPLVHAVGAAVLAGVALGAALLTSGQALVLTRAFATLVGSFWGGFGWLEASLPTAAVVIATVVLVGALGVAFWRGRVWAVRLRLALFVFPTVALAADAGVLRRRRRPRLGRLDAGGGGSSSAWLVVAPAASPAPGCVTVAFDEGLVGREGPPRSPRLWPVGGPVGVANGPSGHIVDDGPSHRLTNRIGCYVSRPSRVPLPQHCYVSRPKPVRKELAVRNPIQRNHGVAEVDDPQSGVRGECQAKQLLPGVASAGCGDVDEVAREPSAGHRSDLGANGVIDVKNGTDVEGHGREQVDIHRRPFEQAVNDEGVTSGQGKAVRAGRRQRNPGDIPLEGIDPHRSGLGHVRTGALPTQLRMALLPRSPHHGGQV